MIKTTIIIILILLLLITLYSYYCISSKMINFERARLEYILQKETELKIKENEIKVITDCKNKNELYHSALLNINNIVSETLHTKSCNNSENIITNEEKNNIEILNEVPSEYIQ